MPLIYMTPYPGQDKPLNAERLLRLLGVTGKLTGFYYAVYMIEQVQNQPENMVLLTKRLYVQTAKHFSTTPNCVERNLRTLVQSCWAVSNHNLLNLIAGAELKQAPTNSQFIDMMAAYLRT